MCECERADTLDFKPCDVTCCSFSFEAAWLEQEQGEVLIESVVDCFVA